jgi:hypothetical protein
VTSTPSRYYARSNLAWTLSEVSLWVGRVEAVERHQPLVAVWWGAQAVGRTGSQSSKTRHADSEQKPSQLSDSLWEGGIMVPSRLLVATDGS